MDVAISGANGFVGSHLGEFLVKNKMHVRGLVRPGKESVVKYFGGHAYGVDYFDIDSLVCALDGVSVVYHFAGTTREAKNVTFEKDYLQVGKNVIAACKQVSVSKIIINSGLGVANYGRTPVATNKYFWSRLAMEKEIKNSGLDYTILRPSTIIGSGRGLMPTDELTPGIVEKLRKQEKITVIGDGKNLFQPIFIEDAVRVYYSCLGRFDKNVFDLVGPNKITIPEYVDLVAKHLNVKPGFEFKPIEVAKEEARKSGEPELTEEEIDILALSETSDHKILEKEFEIKLTPVGTAVKSILEEL